MATRDVAILEVLQEIRSRTRHHVSINVSDATAVGMALTCSMIDNHSLIEFSYDRGVRSDVSAGAHKLALTDLEFATLFGIGDTPPRTLRTDAQLRALEQLPEASEIRTNLSAALVTTMYESGPQAAWKTSAIVRIAAVAALCRTGSVEFCMGAILGGFNNADSRSLEDLRSMMEDEGHCPILLSQAIAALSATVV